MTQGFLTAMRQEVTRAHTAKGWALDGVVLYNDVTKFMKEDITAPPPAEIGQYEQFCRLEQLANILLVLLR